jgi:hypothetical protein
MRGKGDVMSFGEFLREAGIKQDLLSKARRFVFGFSAAECLLFEQRFVNKAIESGVFAIPMRKGEFLNLLHAGCLPNLRVGNHMSRGVLGECRGVTFVEP